MGAGIASIAVQRARSCASRTPTTARVGKGLAAVREVLRERLTKKQITRQQFDDYMSLVGGTTDYSGFGNVDLVIEAVFEDLALKQRVLRESEAVHATRRDLRVEHEHDSDRADRRGVSAARARARDALLLAGARRCRCSR